MAPLKKCVNKYYEHKWMLEKGC